MDGVPGRTPSRHHRSSPPPSMPVWLAVTVYRRGDAEQSALLAALSPVLRALEADGSLASVWGVRHDARGPHVLLLLQALRAEAVRSEVVEALRAHLAAAGPSPPMDEAELLRRHEGCRGHALAPAARLPGLAPPDSWTVEPQPPGDYPLHLLRGTAPATARAYLGAATEAFHWAAARAAAGEGTAAALLHAAALDRALAAAGRAEAAWRHHACTLVLPLRERLERGEDVASSLARAVAPANRARFDAAWAAPADPLASALAARAAASAGDDLPALRELVHCTLLLLGLSAAAELPMVLYAWLRHLEARPGG